jgi:hypothetical protein
MAVFSNNSVRHLYVANGYSAGAAATLANAGLFTGAVKTADNDLYLTYVNVLGQAQKTDSIPVANIRSVKSTPYSPKVLRKDEITFDAPIPGQTYTIRFLIRQWGSGSAEDQYFKHVGSYKAKTGDDAEDLVDAMIVNATKNFAREPLPLFTFTKQGTGATASLIVSEVATPWVIGKSQGRGLNYSIQFVKINNSGEEDVEWGTVTNIFKQYEGVGTNKIAKDMEYFYLGNRGDVYRQVGYPYTFDTQYLTDATANYSIIDIAYFKQEPHNGGAVQSECVLSIMCKENATTSQYTVQIAIAGAINAQVSGLVPVLANVGAKVIVQGAIGTADNTKITGLTATRKYVIYTNPGTPTETKGYVVAAGTVSATETDIDALTGTEITGLTNGARYAVVVY